MTGAIWHGQRVDRRPQETLDGSGWEIEKTTVSGVDILEVKVKKTVRAMCLVQWWEGGQPLRAEGQGPVKTVCPGTESCEYGVCSSWPGLRQAWPVGLMRGAGGE